MIDPGHIEVMVHRRLYKDDSKGVNEPLNETDASGHGISFWVQHIVQIIDLKVVEEAKRHGIELLNRHTEKRLNQPPFITFGPPAAYKFSKVATSTAFDEKDLKINLFPIRKGVIRVRLQNIRDPVDHFTDALQVDV